MEHTEGSKCHRPFLINDRDIYILCKRCRDKHTNLPYINKKINTVLISYGGRPSTGSDINSQIEFKIEIMGWSGLFKRKGQHDVDICTAMKDANDALESLLLP